MADVDALSEYWAVCPDLKAALFKSLRAGYMELAVDKAAINSTIHNHPQFMAFLEGMAAHFDAWKTQASIILKALEPGFHPKHFIPLFADGLLAHYQGRPLVNAYDIYQHLMDYWMEVQQDDAYAIAADGWVAKTQRVIEKTTKGKGDNAKTVEKDKGWVCDLIPKRYVVAQYFFTEQAKLYEANAALEATSSALSELEEEHSGEDMAFPGVDKVTAAQVKDRIREIGNDNGAAEELEVLKQWQALAQQEAELKKSLKTQEMALDKLAYEKYPQLSVEEIKALVVDDKWLAALNAAVQGEVERASHALTQRVKELAERYDTPLPQLAANVTDLEAKVAGHLAKMGFAWA